MMIYAEQMLAHILISRELFDIAYREKFPKRKTSPTVMVGDVFF